MPGREPRPASLSRVRYAGEGFAEAFGALGDLEGGEPVDVHAGDGGLHRAEDVEVEVAVEGGVDAALQAHLGGPAFGGLDGALGDVVEGQQVRGAAQVQRQRSLGEPAERAPEGAHVGVVDVAVDHVGDGVPDRLPAQVVGHRGDRGDLRATGAEEGDDLGLADLLARSDARRAPRRRRRHRDSSAIQRVLAGGRRRIGAQQRGRVGVGAGVPGGGAAADLDDLGTGADVRGGLVPFGPGRTGVVATQRLRVGAVQHREPGRLVQPAVGLRRRTRGRPSAGAPAPGRGPRSPPRSVSTAGQGRSGFTWSGVTGETPPQSSIPASSRSPSRSRSERFGGAWTCTSAGSTSRASAIARTWSSGGQAGWSRIVVPGLGRKFCTITSCTWPCRRCDAAIASSAASRSASVSPMPTRIPVVNGMRQLPGPLQGRQPTLGGLVRGARGGRPGRLAATRSSSPATAPPSGAGPGRSRETAPGVRVRQQAGLLQHPPRHRDQVVHRRGVPVGGQPVARLGVPVLRGLTQGEQRLVAPRLGAAPTRPPAPPPATGTARRCGAAPSRTCSTHTDPDTTASAARTPSASTSPASRSRHRAPRAPSPSARRSGDRAASRAVSRCPTVLALRQSWGGGKPWRTHQETTWGRVVTPILR